MNQATSPALESAESTAFDRAPVDRAPVDLAPVDRQDQFVDEHLHRVYVQIYRIVKNAADAQDLTQETFIKALRWREQLKDEQKAANWLSRIARNTAIDFVRRNSRVSFTGADDLLLWHDDNPERVLMRAEARDGLDQLLRRLTPRERAALTLRDVEGLPAGEVAKQLGCSKATVRTHIANARIKCRCYLDRHRR
ncbi:MAG TPA: sigma-70 family RNA polymerase sigma factor [Candidatus Acidoferrales bacterium]|nr:sigma-70 family RNA polymerase sigma factor [Candidatus Acidoferrales bacterium]